MMGFVAVAVAVAVGAAVGGMLLAGCGTGPRTTDAAAAAERFAAALSAGDADAACAMLTPDANSAVTGSADLSCEEVILVLEGSEAEAAYVQAWGDAAQAVVGDDTIFLLNLDGSWLVDAAGCTPLNGGRYDCEVES
jgi:hypothetical protein